MWIKQKGVWLCFKKELYKITCGVASKRGLRGSVIIRNSAASDRRLPKTSIQPGIMKPSTHPVDLLSYNIGMGEGQSASRKTMTEKSESLFFLTNSTGILTIPTIYNLQKGYLARVHWREYGGETHPGLVISGASSQLTPCFILTQAVRKQSG